MKKVLIISICFSVGFVVVMLFLSHREMRAIESLKVKSTTDEITDLPGQRQRFGGNEGPLRLKVGKSQQNSDVSTTDARLFKVTTLDAVSTVIAPKKPSETASKKEDEEFEAFWKDIEGFVEKYLTDLRVQVDESIAQIEPLFEEAAFYKAQLEPLRRQENWPEFSIAWSGFRQAEGHLYGLYVFLREGPAREHFGDLYLSTPEYAKLKTFAEGWLAQRKTRTVYR